MATGKVILSSDLSALREVLSHKKNSLLAPPKDIKKWISNLNLIRFDSELRAKLGKQAREDFENNYTWNSRAINIIKNN
jgi:glycosyltransferase involved in cell wall biosynthesis